MTADVELLPSSVAAFTEALRGERGSLDAWLEVNDEREVRAHVEAYARANVAHATAAKDAEIEALREQLAEARGGWHMANGTAELAMKHRDTAEARAERLEEALRELRNHTSVNSDQIALIDAAIDQARGKGGGEVEGG